MAIGAIYLAWLRRLAGQNAFSGLNSIIDLGPQDIQLERAVLDQALRDLTVPAKLERLLNSIYSDGGVNRDAQAAFYGLFGFDRYESIDVDDDRATHRLDLNEPGIQLSEFDTVTNFGTTEHVFNIGQAFKTIHNLTRPGGLSLHCVPCFAFINHGFYNVHPNSLVEMVRANDYELVDFSYFDNAFVRNDRLGREGVIGFDLTSLPIQLRDMENTQFFMNKILEVFNGNLVSDETRVAISSLDPASQTAPPRAYPSSAYHICFVFDLVFCAMRRPSERRPFVMPIQNASGVSALESASELSSQMAAANAGAVTLPKASARKWFMRLQRTLSGH